MTKIVINSEYGGYSISEKALELYRLRTGTDSHDFEILRDDKVLVEIVEELGDEASGDYAALKVVEIPDGIEWLIDDYDGIECIAEQHQRWS